MCVRVHVCAHHFIRPPSTLLFIILLTSSADGGLKARIHTHTLSMSELSYFMEHYGCLEPLRITEKLWF